MALMPIHEERLGDKLFQDTKLSPEYADLRAPHLARLEPLEAMIRERAPLPIAYDVTRLHPPYFFEFTYTEMLGCLWVGPQSSEIAARMVQAALLDREAWSYEPAEHLVLRDKYALDAGPERPTRVVFLPGDNMLDLAAAHDIWLRVVDEDDSVMVKPHPMTSTDFIRRLGRRVGYHRVIEPKASGASLIPGLEHAYVTAATEMGLYAVLNETPVTNITRYAFEPRATYTPFYRLLWRLAPKARKAALRKAINSPLSGFFDPDDPDVSTKIDRYFAAAMATREPFRPLVVEIPPDRYADLLLSLNPGGPA
jgi:hypothetical protein